MQSTIHFNFTCIFHWIWIHSYGNIYIKSCWFMIWTFIAFIWPSYRTSTLNMNFKKLFYFISYLWVESITISSIEAKLYGTFKSMFIIKYKESPTMLHLRIKSKFFSWFTSRYNDKWTWIYDKNGTKCYNERLVGSFHNNHIIEYL